jgi:hypothetical protein
MAGTTCSLRIKESPPTTGHCGRKTARVKGTVTSSVVVARLGRAPYPSPTISEPERRAATRGFAVQMAALL